MNDNHFASKYMYEILVETGPLSCHSTTSKIQFILTGTDSHSGVRTFNEPFKHLFTKEKSYQPFQKGATDSFLMTSDHPLGHFQNLRIWTDSSGLGDKSSWFLTKIVVKDLQTDKVTQFPCNRWIAIDRDTYEDDITLIPSKDEYESILEAMKYQYNNMMVEHHIWLSTFSRKIDLRFNRKKKVAICMSSIYLTFCISGYYYMHTLGKILDPIWKLGPVGMDLTDVSINITVCVQ